jgi:hypothetical protein
VPHRHVCLTRFQQEAEWKAIRAALPDYAAIHSHVVQDELARLDKAYQAFLRRVQAGEQPGFPRLQGRERWHSCTDKEYGNGATDVLGASAPSYLFDFAEGATSSSFTEFLTEHRL